MIKYELSGNINWFLDYSIGMEVFKNPSLVDAEVIIKTGEFFVNPDFIMEWLFDTILMLAEDIRRDGVKENIIILRDYIINNIHRASIEDLDSVMFIFKNDTVASLPYFYDFVEPLEAAILASDDIDLIISWFEGCHHIASGYMSDLFDLSMV